MSVTLGNKYVNTTDEYTIKWLEYKTALNNAYKWEDGNPTARDRTGAFVEIIDRDEKFIRLATKETPKESIAVCGGIPGFVWQGEQIEIRTDLAALWSSTTSKPSQVQVVDLGLCEVGKSYGVDNGVLDVNTTGPYTVMERSTSDAVWVNY